MIRAVVQYIRALPRFDDFEQLSQDVFGDAKDPRGKRLKASMLYYAHCTQEGYQKQQKPKHAKRKKYATIRFSTEAKEHQEECKRSTGQEEQEQQKRQKEKSRQKQQHAELVERIGKK